MLATVTTTTSPWFGPLTFGAVLILLGLAINLAGLVLEFITLRRKQDQLQAKQDEIHVLVNQRLDTALERIAQLGESLTAAGVDLPPKPPKDTPPSQ